MSQFLASAAGEKLAVMMTVEHLRREASAGARDDFERYLAAVPNGLADAEDAPYERSHELQMSPRPLA